MTDQTLSPAGLGAPADARTTTAAVVGIMVFSLFSVLLIMMWSRVLGDPDTHWHIAVGRWIVENGAFPRTDSFSHTFAGQPWIAKEWLSQLALYAAFALGGWHGVALIAVLCLTGSLGLLAWWLAQRLRWTLVVAISIFVMMMASGSTLARPHILALPLMLIWTLGLLEARERGRAPHWALIPLMLVWSNAHAGFTIGFVIAGMLALEAVREGGREGWFRAGLAWALFLVPAVIASMITPYGMQAILLTFNLFTKAESLSVVEEWQPITLDVVGWIHVVVMAALIAVLAVRPIRNLPRLILVAFLAYMMVRHARFIMLFGFTAFAIAAVPIRTLWPELRPIAGEARASIPRLFAIVLVALIAVAAIAPRPEPNPLTTPVEALKAARAAGLNGRVYNSYNLGGYLISQGVTTCVDGRSDQLFLGGFLLGNIAAAEKDTPEALLAFLEPYDVNWAIVLPDAREVNLFAAAGWKQVHADDRAVVFARATGLRD